MLSSSVLPRLAKRADFPVFPSSDCYFKRYAERLAGMRWAQMSPIGPKPDLQKSDSPVGFLLFNRLAWGADILLIARPAVLPRPCLSGDSIYPESTYVEGIRSGAHLEFCTCNCGRWGRRGLPRVGLRRRHGCSPLHQTPPAGRSRVLDGLLDQWWWRLRLLPYEPR